MTMKVRQVIRLIEANGWRLVRQRGSHRQFRHATKPGRVTIAGNDGDDVKTGTLASILRRARLKGRRS
jgi:predicted RNA binding protein YcfA (HicA-like mRNA interferase family)